MRHVDWPVLYQAIGRLTRTHQELVTLRFFQELSTAEIAAAMDMREGAVRISLMRALRKLKEELGGSFDGEFTI